MLTPCACVLVVWFRKCGYGEQLFKSYYSSAASPVPADEWAAFFAALQRPLPVTWRVRGTANAEDLSELVQKLRQFDHAAPVAWAPLSAGIWQASTDKRSLSKSAHEAAKGRDAGGEDARLSAVLAEGVSHGLLNRQECVSMLPVMALRVPAGACVLDVCASPGSKTMQLLEAVSAGGCARGMVVANDAHPKRVEALLAALGRHARPDGEHRRLVVTCHRGEHFPAPTRPFRCTRPRASSDTRARATGFDRVLCDVPCSGDGTIRKDPSVLPRWTPAIGTQLHATQLAIAWRGLELLRVGGLMVYSTCSLNPIEDEVRRSRCMHLSHPSARHARIARAHRTRASHARIARAHRTCAACAIAHKPLYTHPRTEECACEKVRARSEPRPG